MAALKIAVALCAVAACARAWQVPSVPAGRRAQFYLQRADGSYEYGYDAGDGHSARAQADAANEVQGRFAYAAPDGRALSVRYSAGRAGYVPSVDGLDALAAAPPAGPAAARYAGVAGGIVTNAAEGQQDADYDANADASYSFNIDTDSYKRQEQADARGNVRGSYSYSSAKGGSHALSYVAGEGTGFVVTGGSSSAPIAAASYSSNAASAYSSNAASAAAAAAQSTASTASDGSYSFGFSTNDQSRQEAADAHNNVRGSYSFRAKDDGKIRRVDYSAGAATGFVAHADHLPVAPEATGAVPPGASARVSAVPVAAPATPYSGPLADIQSAAGKDGSYSFAFGTDLQSRQESADAHNNVRGSYSFRAKDDGKIRRVDYEAGAATGFVARGDHLPVAPSVDGAGIQTSRYSQPDPIPAPHSYSGPASNAQSASGVDGSYAFSFSTNEQSRQESADANNNVRGSYSFRAKDDGKTRRVDYVAGAATGFVASGDHLPVAPEAQAPATISTYAAPIVPVAPVLPAPTVPYSGAVVAAVDSQNAAGADGSYSFSYNAGDHSRQEASDSSNNVRGSYSFRAKDDGKTRRIDYVAGAATGFVASGNDLPVAPAPIPAVPAAPALPVVSVYSAPAPVSPYSGPASNAQSASNADGSYAFSYSTGDQSREESADAHNNVRGSYSFRAKGDGQTRRVSYVAGAATGFVAEGDHLPKASPVGASPASRVASAIAPAAAAAAASSAAGDGSYSFAYDAADHSRQESADSAGNVRGSFSFVAKDDGKARRVDYSAGAATGFLASGAHLPVDGANVAAAVAAANAAGVSGYSASSIGSGDSSSGDASYAYSYQTDSSSKAESSDSQGNVRGQYSYTAGDGSTRRISYTARKEEGFVASGDVGPSGAAGAAASSSGSSIAVSRAGQSAGSAVATDSHGGITIRTGGAVINQYLPPESSHKFGYIYDTKA